ncbi:MAG: preQ(1) synthase [Chthoniobacterales bacterium]|nr:preQ(1) synthase [Chthoniobacterales bacterium]
MPKKAPSPSISKPLTSNTKGLTLLGAGSLPQVDVPSTALLETFVSPAPKRRFEICFRTSEFTSMCPITGQPDYATITIRYVPKERCVESKALKLYLGSFRNQGVFAESIVNRMLDDLVEVLSPRSITVTGDFTPRGGIGLCVEASYPEKIHKDGSDKKNK